MSLMAGTLPAANNAAAFDMALSNLIEVTQTRSAYGEVMNKRAAVGSRSSDTNGRSEPYVGSRVVLRIYEDTLGTPREDTMRWVVDLLFPSLLGWNQWAWSRRRYVQIYSTSSLSGIHPCFIAGLFAIAVPQH